MKIKRIKAKNFLSYEEFDVVFDNGIFMIEGWNYDENTSNGSGKTSILDSVCFSLFGQIPREIKVDDVVNRKFKKNCYCEIFFNIQEDEYSVLRSRKPNNLKITKNGEDIIGKDVKETQELLESIIKIDFKIFINSVYFTQNSKSRFISSNDTEKREILTQVLNLSEFDKASDRCKDELKIFKDKLEKNERESQSVKLELRNLMEECDNFTIKNNNFLKSQKNKIEEILDRKDKINIENKELELRLSTIDSKKIEEEIEVISKKLEVSDYIDNIYNEFKDKNLKITFEKNKLRDTLFQMKNVKKGKCKSCFQEISGNHLKDEIEELELKISKLLEEEKIIEKELDNYLMIKTKLKELKAREGNLQNQKLRCEYEKKDIGYKIEKNNTIIASMTSPEDIEREPNIYLDLLNKKKDQSNKINEDLRELEVKNNELREKINYLSELRKMFVDIKYYIFDETIVDLNSRIEKYLSPLFNMDLSVEFSTEMVNSKKESIQKFNTRIQKDGEEISFESLSDGQKKRIEIATNFALSDIISNSSCSINILVLDEIFNGLDEEGRLKIVELLDSLSQEKENIFIIDHFQSTKSLVDNVIRVELRDGISKILK